MSIPISAIVPVSIPQISPVSSSTAAPGGFQSVLEGLVGGVEKSQAQAQQTVNSFLTGGNEELHSVALAAQRSSLEFDLFMQVRNKVVSAYQEVMRMQV
ncbi:MAG TPA: flagellar hook-basal body complex protein FliE [Bryobacteraceae bacterium]|jgi:flagellar hook-basal body complex protein FliE|nr:flagellar hook-basal body complex protein FliE [Bryobacteraceae bacterium]